MAEGATPLDGVDTVLADLDGVVYRGSKAVDHAVESLTAAAATHRVGYITNNASRTAAAVASQLSGYGLSVAAEDVVTSPQAAVRLLVDVVPAGSTILVVGGEGLTSVLEEEGFVVTRSADDSPAAVVQGFSPDVGWVHLAEASYALEAGIPWIATNTDWTIPQERGIAPGNGTLVSAVHSAAGRLPDVAGKPETPIFQAAVERFSATKALFIGDRLDTDVKGANDAGLVSVLVLTGIDGAKQVLAADARSRPDFILGDLRELSQPYPAVVEHDEEDVHVVTVRDSSVAVRGSVVRVLSAGTDPVDLLRAGAAAVWGTGRAIYGLDVDPALHAGD
ncbi:HAD superfamily hydrolase (TIGR01450 family) [Frigoribacterium sp. PhB160]|uniref:HAD-IIA family hydrolase n=1 Tax=Frigoribacterium sp. PhB160 TaxID=2485192 RepID=UPI000FB8C16C|nr:HAD-IIA family hydrolase [Frigoribacterium sp. PhB160]ROS62679.1 HAD superfamily hydrolase (TIGR01450 family) [Frigoribacterium sp. PhB160]